MLINLNVILLLGIYSYLGIYNIIKQYYFQRSICRRRTFASLYLLRTINQNAQHIIFTF